MSFREIEENLRQSFRVMAAGRAGADVLEMPGVSIASLGAAFQMFNAAFLSAPVETQIAMQERIQLARRHFAERKLPWSFWVCEDWLGKDVRKKLSRMCGDSGLRLAAEMPGMAAERIAPPARPMPELEIRPVDSVRVLEDFRAIGSTCFHVPIAWFTEVFDDRIDARREFLCWVGYIEGAPAATAATFSANGTAGLYNVATLPEHRGRGYGEAMTRYALDRATAGSGPRRMVLQSTSLGFRIYERMGFRAITRILVYNSAGPAVPARRLRK